jgi:hypothetical protein
MSDLPSSGIIRFSQIRDTLQGVNPIRYSDYFSNRPLGANVSGGTMSLPSSGNPMKLSFFYGKRKNVGPLQTFTFTGANQSWVVPANVTQVAVKLWGAGGGSTWTNSTTGGTANIGVGGAGGYAYGVLNVTAGETLTMIVGGGGAAGVVGGSTATAFGGGGRGVGGGSGWACAGGGGRSAIRRGTTELITAAGGGGGGAAQTGGVVNGGPGGGLTGLSSTGYAPSTGGTQTTGGIGGGSTGRSNGTQFTGAGNGASFTTGGGGGWYGGGSGGNTANHVAGGGGGSSYLGGVVSGTGVTSSGSLNLAPERTANDYVSGVAVGGVTVGTTTGSGGNGIILIYPYSG